MLPQLGKIVLTFHMRRLAAIIFCSTVHRFAQIRLSTLNTSSRTRKKSRFGKKKVLIWNIIFHEADKGDSNEHLMSADHGYVADNKMRPVRELNTRNECGLGVNVVTGRDGRTTARTSVWNVSSMCIQIGEKKELLWIPACYLTLWRVKVVCCHYFQVNVKDYTEKVSMVIFTYSVE